MTVKALKKQMMAAIAMVVVSLIALSSSTFAWFASNNRVTAQGLQVQATVEGGIEIAPGVLSTESGSAAYSTLADINMASGVALFPTSTLATATGSAISSNWYHASAATAGAFTAKDGTYSILSLSAGDSSENIYGSNSITQETDQFYDDAGRQYYLVKNFNIRSVSSSKLATALKVKAVTVTQPATPGSGDLDKSIRVAVVCGTNSVIYAPVTGATTSYKVATAVTDGTATFPDAANVNALAATTESSAIAATVPAKGVSTYGGVDIRIYVYYEGEDANHFSNNITNSLDTLSVTVDFEAVVE